MARLAYLTLLLLGSTSLVVSQGTQFITGPCSDDSACASGCCGFNSGLCAGAIIALTRDGGCGHGSGQPNANAANALGQGTFTVAGAASTPTATAQAASQSASTPDVAGAACNAGVAATVSSTAAGTASTASSGSSSSSSTNKGAGNGVGAQFITGNCESDNDCASACCAFNTGKCAGAVVAQEAADGGCGFGDAQPNDNAAKALTGGNKRSLWDD